MKQSKIIASLFAALIMTGCNEELDFSSGKRISSGSGPIAAAPAEVDKKYFDAFDLNAPGLAGVKKNYEEGKYYDAASALLEYFRSGAGGRDSGIDLINPVISTSEMQLADLALSKNGYRFYAEGFWESDGKPLSYMKDKGIDWTIPSSEAHANSLSRLAWMPLQGLAYRVSHDETYAKEWVSVYKDWSAWKDTSAVWNAADAGKRIDGLVSAWGYFHQSSNVTPEFAAFFMADLHAQAERLKADVAAGGTSAAAALLRAGTVFADMKDAAAWKSSAEEILKDAFDKSWFEVLDLDYPGLEAVKSSVGRGELHSAAEAFLKYWRNRSAAVNPDVDLAAVTVSDSERRWADMALKENGYRFYVKGFFENASDQTPYSYITAENGINWTYWPTGDQEHRYQLHRHQWMLPQAKTYAVTGDEKYASGWMQVYSDWLAQNPRPSVPLDYTLYPENQAPEYRNAGWSWRPLEVASRILDQCGIAEYFKASPTLDAQFLMKFAYHFDEHVNHVTANYSATSNHLITQAQAVATAGILFPEFKKSAEWIASGASKLNNEVSAQYYADGWLKDGDLQYHISSIEDFRSTMAIAGLNGKSQAFPPSYLAAMKKMAEVVMHMTYPDYSVPNMADTRTASWTNSVLLRNFKRYSEMFPEDAALEWMASEGAKGQKPAALEKYFPDAGYHVMRSGWDKKDIMLVLQASTANPNEKWHRQWDANTFELYVGGRQLFPDSGCYTYTTNADRRKYAATAAHNTLTLDGKNVADCKGKVVASNTIGGTPVLSVENPSYAGLTHRRTVFFVDRSYFVIVDEAYGNASGTVNLNFHLLPGADSEVVLDPADNGAHTAFADGNNVLVRTFSDSGALTFAQREGFYSRQTGQSVPRKAYRVDLAKTPDAPARYVTVILPCASPAAENVSAEFPGAFSPSKVEVKINVGGKSATLSTDIINQ